MRTLGKLIAFFAILFAAYVVWSLVREYQAKDDVRAFCGRFPVGTPMAEVAKAAATEGERFLRRIRDDQVSVSYVGAVPFSRHTCTIKGKEGKVAETRISHLD